MKNTSIDVIPNWFDQGRYIDINLTPQQWLIQLKARREIRGLIDSDYTVTVIWKWENESFGNLDKSN